MKYILLLLVLACGRADKEMPTTDNARVNSFTYTNTGMYLSQDGDTIHLPLHPDYKEYIFWWTVTGPREYTWHTSLLYLKSKPSKARLRREANRVTHYIGGDSSTVVVRDVMGFDPGDSTKWDKAMALFEKRFLATIN